MATIQNARDVLLQAAATRLETVAGPTNVTTDFANVTGSTRPSNNADVTTTILTSSGTSIVMNNANLFKSGSGAGGVFIGSGGLFGKNSGGTETFAIDAGTGAVRFTGDISGGSNLNITGSARFRGTYTGSLGQAAVYANESGGALGGVIGVTQTNNIGVAGWSTGTGGSAGIGVSGTADGASGVGVSAYANSGTGVLAESGGASGIGVLAKNVAGGYALYAQGPSLLTSTLTWNGYTYSAPAGSTSTYMRNDGTWSNPVTTSAVNAAFGASESDVCQLVVTDSGTATVAGSGFNLNCTVSGVQTVGSGNTVVIQTISDARLKQDIEDEALGLAFIQQLRPRTYRMRSNPALRYHGFIYQEVAELMRDDTPDALALHRPGSYGGVDYMSLVAPLVLAVQQLAARVQQLESA